MFPHDCRLTIHEETLIMVRKVRFAIYKLGSFYRLIFSDARKWQSLEHALAHILIPPAFTHLPPSGVQQVFRVVQRHNNVFVY